MAEKAGLRYEGISTGKLRRYFSWQNFVDFFKVPFGVMEAKGILRKFSPDVVFSKGGYVSLPVVIAARRLGIPVLLHESDVQPGLANKICARYADKICVSFEESCEYFKKWSERVVVTGNPVRESLKNGSADVGYKFTGLDCFRPVVLVMGGSQGALQINNLIDSTLDELLKKFQIVHVRGRGNLNIGLHKRGYAQYEYLEEQIKDVYAMCEMVITRGGANSLTEIAFLQKKAIIIPLGTQASRGDQIENAKVFARKFGWTVLEGEISAADFTKSVEMTYKNALSSEKFSNGVAPIVKLINSYENRS